MSKININPNAAGTGTLTITSPNTNTDYTLTLPSGTGTFNISGTPNEVPAGTASAPSIYFSGDTNTGIYSPGSDTIAFTEGGVEAMRLDSSGNLLVGTTSSLVASTASISVANTFGYRNRIINGNMSIAQRATSATVTAGTGVPTASTGYPAVDRFFVYSTGANVTAARVAGTGAVQHRMQITGAASVTAVGVGQRIEQLNSYDLAGSTAILSVDLANSVLTTVTWTASYANTADTFGTIGTPTKTQIATGTFTVTSTVTNYSVSISIPAAATTGIEILFTVGAQTSGTWTIGNVQLEKGSVETAFDYRPYTTELQLCQRYYWKFGDTSQEWRYANWLDSTSIYSTHFDFPVQMRTTPTVSTGTFTYRANGSFTDGTINTSVGDDMMVRFALNCPSAPNTAGYGALMRLSNAAWAVAAEL